MARKFDPSKSLVNSDKLQDFLREELVQDIRSVPGIGPKAAESMAEDGVRTTYQLIGKFLSFCDGSTTQEACDNFWSWLGEHKVAGWRSGVTEAIAEKTNMMIPGIYNAEDL